MKRLHGECVMPRQCVKFDSLARTITYINFPQQQTNQAEFPTIKFLTTCITCTHPWTINFPTLILTWTFHLLNSNHTNTPLSNKLKDKLTTTTMMMMMIWIKIRLILIFMHVFPNVVLNNFCYLWLGTMFYGMFSLFWTIIFYVACLSYVYV